MKIQIINTGDLQWDLAAYNLAGEEGVVTNTTLSDGVIKYDAQFAIYGAMFFGIPSPVCTIT